MATAASVRVWPAPHPKIIARPHPAALSPGMVIVPPRGEPLLIWDALLGQGGTAAVYACVPLSTAVTDGTLDDDRYLAALPAEPGVYEILTSEEVAELRSQPGIRPVIHVVKLSNPPGLARPEVVVHFRERLRQEGRLLGGMAGDPSFPVVIGAGDLPLPYLTMSFIPGTSLAKIVRDPTTVTALGFQLAAAGRLPWTFIYFAISKTARAVGRLHDRVRVVHRDLKPENTMIVPLTGSGDTFLEVVILDLGIAKELIRTAEDLPDLTAAFGAAGLTPRYCAPEQVVGGQITQATDTFALGRILCELCEGPGALTDPTDLNDPRAILESLRRPLPNCTHPDLHPALRSWLQELWREMTSFEASKRPTLPEVLRRLKHIEATRTRALR